MTISIMRNIKTSSLIIIVHDPPIFMQNGVGVKGIPIPEAFHCWIGLDCSPFTEHRTAWHA